MSKFFKIPLVLEPQKEGGWTITSPILPELITEIDDIKHLNEVVEDAVSAVLELYEDTGKELPSGGHGDFDSSGYALLNGKAIFDRRQGCLCRKMARIKI